MARNVQVLITDDINGEPGAQTVTFSLESKSYEIDLTEDSIRRLRDAFAPWIAAARPSGSTQFPTQRNRSDSRDPSPAEVRRWAKESGMQVLDRGRLPIALREKYAAAH
jgi:hypothetical protein